MKKIFLFLLMVFSTHMAWAANYCTASFSAKACWLFNQGTGTTLNDSSGNSNTGAMGSVVWQNTDLPARSYITYAGNFNSNKVTMGTTSVLFPTAGGTPWSMVGWFKSSGGSPLRFFDKSTNTTTDGANINSTSAIQFSVVGSTTLSVISSTTFSTTNWFHLAITWDGSTTATNVHIYLNGTEVSYGTQTNGLVLTDTSANNFILGGRSTDNTRNWDKYMSEVAIFNQVLTGAQITDIYNNGLGAYGVSSTTTINGAKITNAIIN